MAKTGEQQQRVASNSHATTSFAYCALPLRIPERLNTLAHIYVKPFRLADTPAPGEEVAINGQTLFFTGLPLGMDQDSTRTLFQQFGNVTHVVLHHNKVRVSQQKIHTTVVITIAMAAVGCGCL